MVKIDKAYKKEIDKFSVKGWHGVDIEHYGKRVNWKLKNFLFKAVENGEIVGIISGKHESGVLYIDEIIVAATQRGKGIGKALMQSAEEFGKKEGAHKAHLITGKDWNSVRFYISLGFSKIAELPNHHFKRDFVIFEKFIT